MPPRKLPKDSISSELIDGAGTFNPPRSTLLLNDPIKVSGWAEPYRTDNFVARHTGSGDALMNEAGIHCSDLADLITAIRAIDDANLAPLRLEVLRLALTKAKALLA